jgi:hypothetical protein
MAVPAPGYALYAPHSDYCYSKWLAGRMPLLSVARYADVWVAAHFRIMKIRFGK